MSGQDRVSALTALLYAIAFGALQLSIEHYVPAVMLTGCMQPLSEKAKKIQLCCAVHTWHNGCGSRSP
jgi:hypothetical protein